MEFALAYFCSINVNYALNVLLDTWKFAPAYFCSINVKYALYVSLDTWSLPQYISVVSMLIMLFMYRWIPGVCPRIFL